MQSFSATIPKAVQVTSKLLSWWLVAAITTAQAKSDAPPHGKRNCMIQMRNLAIVNIFWILIQIYGFLFVPGKVWIKFPHQKHIGQGLSCDQFSDPSSIKTVSDCLPICFSNPRCKCIVEAIGTRCCYKDSDRWKAGMTTTMQYNYYEYYGGPNGMGVTVLIRHTQQYRHW